MSGSSILPTLASSEEMRDRLERGLDCVKRLTKLFPGQSSAGRGSRSLEQMTDAFQQKNSALTEKDSAYQTMNLALKETKAAVQEKDSALTAKQTALESRIQALTDKDAALIEKERQRAEANSYSHIIASAHHEWLSSSPKTSAALLQQCPPQYRHWEWKYLNRITQSELLSFRGHKFSVLAVAVSHDGLWLAVGGWRLESPCHRLGSVRRDATA